VVEQILSLRGGLIDENILTIADILMLTEVIQFCDGQVNLDEFPNITIWLQKWFKLEAVRAAHTRFFEFARDMKIKTPIDTDC